MQNQIKEEFEELQNKLKFHLTNLNFDWGDYTNFGFWLNDEDYSKLDKNQKEQLWKVVESVNLKHQLSIAVKALEQYANTTNSQLALTALHEIRRSLYIK